MYAFIVKSDKGYEVHKVIKSEVFAVVTDMASATRVADLIHNGTAAKPLASVKGKAPAAPVAAEVRTRGRRPGYSPKAAKAAKEAAAGNGTTIDLDLSVPAAASVHTPAQANKNAPPVDETKLEALVNA